METITIDWTGTGLIVIAVIMLELGITWGGQTYSWSDPLIIILLVVGGALMIIFLLAERDAKLPIIPLKLFRIRNVIIPSAASFFLGFTMLAVFVYLPFWFQVQILHFEKKKIFFLHLSVVVNDEFFFFLLERIRI